MSRKGSRDRKRDTASSKSGNVSRSARTVSSLSATRRRTVTTASPKPCPRFVMGPALSALYGNQIDSLIVIYVACILYKKTISPRSFALLVTYRHRARHIAPQPRRPTHGQAGPRSVVSSRRLLNAPAAFRFDPEFRATKTFEMKAFAHTGPFPITQTVRLKIRRCGMMRSHR